MMPLKIIYQEPHREIVLDQEPGGTILEASLANGIAHYHARGGKGRCTTCRGLVVEAAAAGLAGVALTVRSGVVPAVARHRGAVASRAADAVGPAVLPDQLVALRVLDQRRQVHEGLHGRHRSKRADPSSTPRRAGRYPRGPTTTKP